LIASPRGGMEPLTGPINWEPHNRGITPSFFERREPKLDEDGKVVIDATGAPAEHVSASALRVIVSRNPCNPSRMNSASGLRTLIGGGKRTIKRHRGRALKIGQRAV
jgi:hypothetical protein